MRKIKFRGKRKLTGQWIYGTPLFIGGRCFILNPSPYGLEFEGMGHSFMLDIDYDLEIAIETLGQYVDLDDKNEKEIYEGDIVGTYIDKENTDYDDMPTRWVQVVKWDKESYVWRIWDQQIKTSSGYDAYAPNFDGNILDLSMLDDPEVIGDIYTTSEVFEKEKNDSL